MGISYRLRFYQNKKGYYCFFNLTRLAYIAKSLTGMERLGHYRTVEKYNKKN